MGRFFGRPSMPGRRCVSSAGDRRSRDHDVQEFRDAHPEVPWSIIIGMRHRIVHDYRDLRVDILWSTVQDDVQEFIRLVEPLVPPAPEEPG
jgi:hypothetical protein